MLTVFVHGLETYAHHGVSDDEQAIGHRYQIDLEVDLETSATISDSVADTVDYGELAAHVLAQMSVTRRRTLERLGHEIASSILETFPSVQAVRLSVAKIAPPAPIIAKDAGVRLALIR